MLRVKKPHSVFSPLTVPYSLILFNSAASLCQSHQCFKRRQGPITALCNVGETGTCTHTYTHRSLPPHHHLSVNKGFFYSWVTKHDPIIPKLDSKLKNPLLPSLPLISLPPALWGLYKALEGGFWVHMYVYVCVCVCVCVGGGVTNTSTLSFDYSNYDLERGVDYYEHMGRWVVDELTSLQSVSIYVKAGWQTKAFAHNVSGWRATGGHNSHLILEMMMYTQMSSAGNLINLDGNNFFLIIAGII